MTLANASSNDANDVLNIFHHGSNVMLGKNGTIYVPVIINNSSGTRNVYLYMLGKKAGSDATHMNHGSPAHYHGKIQIDTTSYPNRILGSSSAGSFVNANGFFVQLNPNEGTSDEVGRSAYNYPQIYTAVPNGVQIWIDGSNYTSTIGDPNAKGATMYDAVNFDWGIDGTTEWDTGKLTLTSAISWTAGLHYIELKETGNSGGTLIYHVAVNAGY